MASKFSELAVDCADPHRLARFWCAVLDYEVVVVEGGVVTIGSPLVPEGKDRPGPIPPLLTFAPVPEGSRYGEVTERNRVHVDVRAAHGLEREARI